MVSIDNLKFKYQSLPDNKKAVVKMGIILGGLLLKEDIQSYFSLLGRSCKHRIVMSQ